ncbi:MAG TPA: hypothetical protein EYP49_16335 [Anaerolineae bacterium]|nr:hypothetical protein [Anaerolineae bacterium]
MKIKVMLGKAKPCPDLARRLAMVYDLLLRRAEEVEAGERKASADEALAATSAEASESQTLTTE